MKNPVEQIQKKAGVKNRIEFAKKVGIGYATIYNLQKGMPTKMSYKTAQTLSRYCDMAPVELQNAYQSWREEQIAK